MNEDMAMNLMAKLIVATNGWDEAKVRGWTMMLMDLTDDAAAERAVTAVCKSWTMASAPPWGKLLESYQSQPRNDRMLPAGRSGPTMSLHEYLAKVKNRALEGDRNAVREFAQWKHYMARSDVWLSAIGGAE